MMSCNTSLNASSFRIQDFSIATPLEQLAKDIFHCLHSVKNEWFETKTKHNMVETQEAIFIFKKQFSSSHKHYTLEFFESLPFKKCHDHLTFFFGKKHVFQRCFSVNSSLILSVQKTNKPLPLTEAKMLLDALLLGCQEMKLSLPCFVLLNKDSSHYIGEFVSGSLNNLFQMIHFETILEPYTFKEPCQLYLKDHQLSVCDLYDRYEFFKKFCTLTFLFQRYPTLLHTKQISGFFFIQGFRYIYFLDQFTPLRNTFWISLLPTTASHEITKSSSLPNILDPITQLHCTCTWKPTKTAFDNLWTSLDPWNASECTWTLRVVGSQDRTPEELNSLLHVTTTFRKIVTFLYDLQCATTDVKFYTQSQLDKTFNFFFFDQQAFLDQLVDYIFDTTATKENQKNNLYTITNSFLFRLTHSIKQLSSSDMLIHLWNHVMIRIQYYWDNKILIPNVYKESPYATKGHPKAYDPPLLQKLKVLNCCIQQYHVVASFQQKNKQTLLCTVCPPFDFETSHTEYTFFRENLYKKNFLPLEALMEYFLLKHYSPSLSCENLYLSFYKWIKSFSKTFYLSTSYSFLPHCDPLSVKNQSSFSQCNASEKASIRNLWSDVWNKFVNNTTDFKTPTLFEPLKLGEMALSFLKYMTPIEICLQILFSQIYFIIKRFKKSSSLSEITRNYFYDWLNYIIFMLQYKKFKEHSDIWKTWNLKQSITLHLKHFKWFHAYSNNSSPPECISFEASTTSIQKLQLFELHYLYEESLKEKLPDLPTNLVHDLLNGIHHSTDTLILDDTLKKNCLTLFSVETNEMPGSISYSPLPLLPLNTEYIYGFGFEKDVKESTSQEEISAEENNDRCIQDASSLCFFSRLGNECRIALTQKII